MTNFAEGTKIGETIIIDYAVIVMCVEETPLLRAIDSAILTFELLRSTIMERTFRPIFCTAQRWGASV